MTPAEQGRFCASCQKTVMDFTMKNDREVARFFEEGAQGTCGRFRPDQLNRPLHLQASNGLGARLRAWGLVMPGLLLGGWAQAQTDKPVLLGKVACPKPAVTQVEPRIMGDVVVAPTAPLLGDTVLVETPKIRTVTGIVMDKEMNEPLIGATILLQGTELGAVSNMDGRYELEIPADMQQPVLQYSYTGYFSQEVAYTGQAVVNIDFLANPFEFEGQMMLGAIVVEPQEETVYAIAKRKIHQWKNKLRQRKTKKVEQPQTVEVTLPPPAPIIPLPELPAPALPEALPVQVFPNPFTQEISVKMDCPTAEHLTLRLLDMQGQAVFSQIYEAMKGPQVLTLNITGVSLPAGQYLLEVSNGEALRYAGLVQRAQP